MRYTKDLGNNSQTTMTTKEKLLQEIEQSPETLLKEVKVQAKNMGLDTQKFIRISLEGVVRRKAG